MGDHSACAPAVDRSLFCATCGKLREAGSLAKVRLQGFTGAASLNRHVRAFLDTGEPELLDRRVNLDGTGLGV